MRNHEPRALTRARKLRRQLTHAEALLWIYLRRDRAGLRIRRQHPIGPFIADFACVPARLIVEVDGATHGTDEEITYDRGREGYLRRHGWRVVRITNEHVYTNLDGVLEGISELVRARCPLHRASRGPPPRPASGRTRVSHLRVTSGATCALAGGAKKMLSACRR